MSETLTTEQVEEILALALRAVEAEPFVGGPEASAAIRAFRAVANDPQTVSFLATELLALRKRVGDERKRAVAAIHWVFNADGTVGERAMAQEAIHKINDPTFMTRALEGK